VIVVTDTSVVLNLCLIGREALLPELFGKVIAPETVAGEFQRLASQDPRFRGLVFPEFVEKVVSVTSLPSTISVRGLHDGEIAAISLALERKADAVLMDERVGTVRAISLGLKPVDLLGILLEAKALLLIPALLPLLDRLETEADFWIGAELRNSVLRSAGEA